MDFLADALVGKPLNILVVSIVFLAGYLMQRFARKGQRSASPWPLRAALAWSLYAAWEWQVLLWSPEANIRVDLLVIWPALAVISLWALLRALG